MERIKRHFRLYLGVLATAALIGSVAPVAEAKLSAGQAKATVQKILNSNRSSCHLKKRGHISAKRAGVGWRVSVEVSTFGNVGTAIWTVTASGRATAAEALAADIQAGCPG